MTMTEEDVEETYNQFCRLMVAYHMSGEEFPLDFTLTSDNGKIYTMSVDLIEETLQ